MWSRVPSPRPAVPAAALALAVCLAHAPAFAQWPDGGRALCTATGEQSYPAMLSDGSSGAFVVWEDRRGSASDIYAQRVTSEGSIAAGWPADGRALCTATQDQVTPVLAPDGAGGVFVAWVDYRAGGANPDLYLQRLTGAGAVSPGWPANGIAVCSHTAVQGHPTVVSDGAGGVIVAWDDNRGGTFDIYAQRLNGAGAAQWAADGVPVAVATGAQRFPVAVADAAGGMIVAWVDAATGDDNVSAQRLSSAGAAQWGPGVSVCTAASDQVGLRIDRDGAGGAVLAWEDLRDENSDVYAQRLNPAGAPQWTGNGVALCTESSEQYGVALTDDGAGGAFVAWNDLRIGEEDIYVQHVTAAGAIAAGWPDDGRAACAALGTQYDPQVTGDGVGGVFVSWVDTRTGTLDSDVYAQHLTGAGGIATGWVTDGLPFCSSPGHQGVAALVPDGVGGGLIAWQDPRSGTLDIYAQRFTATGGNAAVDVPWTLPAAFEWFPAGPNPLRDQTRLHFRLAHETRVAARIVDVTGRRVRGLLEGTVLGAGDHTLVWDGRDQHGRPVPDGVYLYLLEAGRDVKAEKLAVVH